MAALLDDPALREKTHVFRGREDAGHVLARLIASVVPRSALVLAIPAGGVPVAVALAEDLALPCSVAVVSKITLPWNAEAGYGAMAWDGTLRLNHELMRRLALTEGEVQEGIARTHERVMRRVRDLAGGSAPDVAGRPVIVVDDGLASGFTLRTAVAAVRASGAASVLVAVPTAHDEAAVPLAREVELLACANLRSGAVFAVADAYRRWSDVTDDEARRALAGTVRAGDRPAGSARPTKGRQP